ncbi:MAG TPA: error-prone DNA polymerase [Gemmatimonadaceae bacterium]|nr:error-prone DNA polymerase [Gemmatimonadaceae bacterium]
MPHASYVELHCHSAFSLLDGASHPEALVARALALGYQALALTDHDDLGGIPSFAQAGHNDGLEAIIGVELTVIGDERAHERERDGERQTPEDESPDERWEREAPGRRETHGSRNAAGPSPASSLHHLVLLAESRRGYANLCTLVTRARMDNPRGRPRVFLDTLSAHADGVFALTGCPRGLVPRLLARGSVARARAAAGMLSDIFGGRIAIECWDHALAEERALVQRLIPLARAVGVPWVVTNDVHYAEPAGRMAHDVLCALRHGKTLDQMGTRLRPNGEWYLKSPAQVARRWRAAPQGVRATLDIAARCAFRLRELRPTLPAFPLPPGVTEDEYLERLVMQGAMERWGGGNDVTHARRGERSGVDGRAGRTGALSGDDGHLFDGAARLSPRHRRQLAHELATIRALGLAGYFLIVWDIVRFARREGILCQGRGSAANSAVCFCLGITAVDPIKLELLFERFLSEERHEAPDIDIDFAHRDREKVLQYVYDRYGREHAAMVCEQITYRSKAAVRDLVKVLDIEPPDDAVVLSDERWTPVKPKPAARESAARENGAHERASHEDAAQEHGAQERGTHESDAHASATQESLLHRLVRDLRHVPRHRSIHVGGFVLTREPLPTVVPIEPASMDDRTIVQWDKDDVEACGLVKIDLLGLGMLTLLQDCLSYVRATRGITIDLAQLDMNDQAVYDDLCRADTIGIFQVESRAQMSTLPRLKPRCFYDLVVEVALIRPGPIQGDMVHPYLRRRAGEEPVTYPHPSLEPILARTLGVPLFQEQGMRVAITAAGFTPGEADALRRAMGHKRSRERMANICEKLIQGMARNGIAEETARRIYQQINAFADYGFPESHAASFALLVYASAYLKHYYAPEFTAAILNAQPMGFYAPGTLIEDARRHGVEVLPVDLTRSRWECTLEWRERARESRATNGGANTPASGGRGRDEQAARDRADRGGARANQVTGATGVARMNGPVHPAVRLGLRLVRGLGAKAREKLARAAEDGPFASVGDVICRTGLDRRALTSLAEAGAFDAFIPDEPRARRRRAAVWRMLEEWRGDAGPLAPAHPRLVIPEAIPAMSAAEITEADYRMTGVSLNGHPLRHLRALLAPNGVCTARKVLSLRGGARDVAVAGLVICRQRPGTAKGFVFLTLEDETGMVNVVVTPKRFERQAVLISTAPLLLVRGTLQVEQGVVNLRGESFRALTPRAGEQWVRGHDFH